jgi:hypothetical protein
MPSIDEETALWRRLDDAERLAHLRVACRAARRWLAYHPEPDRALAHRDPLPVSTEQALERLRTQYRPEREA